ncbi:eukaryotic translation initiation factor 2-alpha kinase [Dispira simplex]|nr:eukaryotic translation initiation factor 2-alpha kinase [Dispira simplex]
MDELTTDELFELQTNEVAALEAIYMDDFERVESTGVWKISSSSPEFRLTLRPLEPDLQHRIHVVLRIRLPKLYPKRPPIVTMEMSQGLQPGQQQDLTELIQSTAKQSLGNEMVFELATAVQEYITNHHAPVTDATTVPSSHQAMLNHEARVQQEKAQREEQARLAREQEMAEAELHANRELEQKILQELGHKRSMIWKERQRQQLRYARPGPLHQPSSTTYEVLTLPDLTVLTQTLPSGWQPWVTLPDPVHLTIGPEHQGFDSAMFQHLLCSTPHDFHGLGLWYQAMAIISSKFRGNSSTSHQTIRGRPRSGSHHLHPHPELQPPTTFTIHHVTFQHHHYRSAPGHKRMIKVYKEVNRLKALCHENVVTIHDAQLLETTGNTISTIMGTSTGVGFGPGPDVAAPDRLADKDLTRTVSTPVGGAVPIQAYPSMFAPFVPGRSGETGRNAPPLATRPEDTGPRYPKLYILMENTDKSLSLAQVLETGGPLAWPQVKRYTQQLLHGLAYIHANGFVHKNLGCHTIFLFPLPDKPQRVAKLALISYHRTLLDLHHQYPLDPAYPSGVSSLLEPPWLTEANITTPSSTGDHRHGAGKKDDMYRLSQLILLMLWGLEAPQVFAKPENALHALQARVPPELINVLYRMLHREPKHRPTALELLADPVFVEGSDDPMGRIPALYLLAPHESPISPFLSSNTPGGALTNASIVAHPTPWMTGPAGPSSYHPTKPALATSSSDLCLSGQRTELSVGGVGSLGMVPSGQPYSLIGPSSLAPVPHQASPVKAGPITATANTTAALGSLAKLPGHLYSSGHHSPLLQRTSRHRASRRSSSSTSHGGFNSLLSRYRLDFEEIVFLGKGGYGEVVKARNKLDNRFYAVKKIKLDPRDVEMNRKILREVSTLSRLHHEFVVRYYTTWYENANGEWDDHPSTSEGFYSTDGFSLSESEGPSLLSPDLSSEGKESRLSDEDDEAIPTTSFHNDLLFVDESHSKSVPGIHFGRIGGEYSKNLPTSSGRRRSKVNLKDRSSAAPGSSSLIIAPLTRNRRGLPIPGKTPTSESEDSSNETSWRPSARGGRSPELRHTSKFFSVSPSSQPPNLPLPPVAFSESSSDDQKSLSLKVTSTSGLTSWSRRKSSLSSQGSALAAVHRRRRPSRRDYRILYIQMEYCENNTLRDAIDQGLNMEEGWRLFRQILEGLVYIHSQGVIHRDLKPSNVFLDANGDVKIGDFGLAIANLTQVDSGSTVRTRQFSLEGGGPDESLTSDVGTTLYVAPEVAQSLKGGGSRYNQKVDMYSLGIIFFEMCYPLHTGMERAKVLHDLRRPEVIFPVEFPDNQLVNQKKVIQWLLHHNPRDRPTSLELFQSDLLPPRMEDDYIQECVRTIANPHTPYYNRLMSALFDQLPDRPKDFTYDFNSGVADLEHTNSVYYDRVHDYLTRVLRRHGAVEVCTPLMMPKLDIYDQFQQPVCLMDPTGTLVQLPYDLTLPFARYVARNKIQELKRFSFDKIYKENTVGGQPRQIYEVDFDSVWSHPTNPVGGAEVLKVVDEVFEDLPVYHSKPLLFVVNHTILLDVMFDHLRIPTELYRPVCAFLRQLGLSLSMAQVRQNLLAQLHIPRTVLDAMEQFNVQGDLATVRQTVLGILADPHLRARAQVALDDLKALERVIQMFHLKHRLVYCPLLVNNYAYYRDHFFFQLVIDGKKREVLATGGRYDRLVEHFLPPNKKVRGTFVAAAGANIAIQKIIFEVASYQSSFLRSLTFKHDTVPASFGIWSRKRCDVAIASFGRPFLAERIDIVQELWQHNIRTDFLYDDSDDTNSEMVTRICVNQGINWIVNIKVKQGALSDTPEGRTLSAMVKKFTPNEPGASTPLAGIRLTPESLHSSEGLIWNPRSPPPTVSSQDLIFKVRNLIKHTEEEISRAELPAYLLAEINEQNRHDLQLHDNRPKKHSFFLNEHPELSSSGGTHHHHHSRFDHGGSAKGYPPYPSTNGQGPQLDANALNVQVLPGGPRSRMKDRQKQLIAERASHKIMELTSTVWKSGKIPVLAVDLSAAILKKIAWCNLLEESGLKRALEVCSAHQKEYLRQLVEAIVKQQKAHLRCFYVWLYSYRDDYAAIFQLE